MHEVLVNRLGGLSLPRKSVVRLTDRPDMTLDVYRGRKTTMQCNEKNYSKFAKDRYHINPIQKKFENMYFIIDSSDINSVFSIQLQNE